MGSSGDIWIPRLVVSFLGLATLAVITISGIISYEGREIPPGILGLGTTGIVILGSVVTNLYGPGTGRKNGDAPPKS
jgi:hypothetical protein